MYVLPFPPRFCPPSEASGFSSAEPLPPPARKSRSTGFFFGWPPVVRCLPGRFPAVWSWILWFCCCFYEINTQDSSLSDTHPVPPLLTTPTRPSPDDQLLILSSVADVFQISRSGIRRCLAKIPPVSSHPIYPSPGPCKSPELPICHHVHSEILVSGASPFFFFGACRFSFSARRGGPALVSFSGGQRIILGGHFSRGNTVLSPIAREISELFALFLGFQVRPFVQTNNKVFFFFPNNPNEFAVLPSLRVRYGLNSRLDHRSL